MRPDFEINQLTDRFIRRNFEKLRDFINKESLLDGFRGFELTFTETHAHYKFRHGLGFLPKDLLQTSLIGSGTVIYNYSLSTDMELDLTITGAVSSTDPTTVRFIVGTMETQS